MMTGSSRREHSDLLVRARAAPETPGDLDDATRSALIEELAIAGTKIAGIDLKTLDVALVDSGDGTRFYVAESYAALARDLAAWWRPRWSRIGNPRDPATLDDQEIVATYFAGDVSEYFAIGTASLASDEATIEQGRYCVLSTAHLSLATADRLERWAPGPATPPPLAVASNFYGWFVSTREPDDPDDPLPDDLRAVLRFGRDSGFDHVLFDSDGGQVEELTVHDW